MTRAPEIPEESLSFRIAVLVALMTSGCAALQQGVGSPIVWVVVLIGYPLAFFVAYATRHRRPPLLRFIVTAGAVLVLMMFTASISGQALSGFASLQVPLAEVFLWLLLLHGIDSPSRRGLLIALLSSVVLIAVAGVLSLTMAIVPYLVVWAIAAVAALVLAQRSALALLPDLASRTPRARQRAAAGSLTAVLAIVLVMAVVGAALFMFAPVAGTDRALTFPAELPQAESVPVLGGLANPSLGSSDPTLPTQPGQRKSRASFGYFGFSNQLDTATRGRPDNTLVMRVRASAPDYWRAQSFDRWDGRVWTASRTRPTVIRGSQPIPIPPAPDDGPPFGIVGTDQLVQTYYVERTGPNAIFAAATPAKLFFSDRIVFQMPDGSLRAGVQLDAGSVYTVVSQRRLVTVDALRASDPVHAPDQIQRLYASPPVTTARVRELATAITAGASTNYDKIVALENWMGAHTKYTLNIPPLPPGKDAVDQFLFVDHRGFCEQIGTSLVVMLRALGIPARLTVGYATGERNPFTGLYEVRAKDAHAWAEVYFPGIGWQGFDPTAHVPLAGDSSIDAAGTGALAYLSARISIPAWAPIVVAALALAIAMAVLGRFVIRRRSRRRDRVEPSWAATRLARLETLGAHRGRARSPGETTPEYAQALARLDPLAQSHLLDIARILDAVMFSPVPERAEDRAVVDEALDDLAERWRGVRDAQEHVLVGS
jgi:protein-glutamine gamma-glutamyltransferase